MAIAPAMAETLPNEIITPNRGSAGIFDPSVAVDPESGRLWLAHSIVTQLGQPEERAVAIGLSFFEDERWRSVANPAEVIYEADGSRWQAEVATLFRDPLAPPEGRWKLLYHRYPHAGGQRKFEDGWIALKSAATPDGLGAVAEMRWLTGRGYVGAEPAAINAIRIPGLERCVAFTEPGALVDRDSVYVAMMCPERRMFRGVRPKIVVLSCALPCEYVRPEAWRLRAAGLEGQGDSGFSAPALVRSNGAIALIVTPTSNIPFHGAYHGCTQYGLVGDAIAPVATARVSLPKVLFQGACAALPDGAWLLSALTLTPRPFFHIVRMPDPGTVR